MSEQTKISWCDSTLNFWEGCTKVSPGCQFCYAEARDKRFTGGKLWGKGAPRRKSKSAIKDAVAFNRRPWICDECGAAYTLKRHANPDPTQPMCSCTASCHRRRIFSLSLGDMNDEEIKVEWRSEAWHTIWKCADVTWIICSKRWQLWKSQMGEILACQAATGSLPYDEAFFQWIHAWIIEGVAPANIIILTSVENQAMADKRIPELLKIPAACRGLSLEPLLGPVKLDLLPCYFDNGNRLMLKWLIIGGESGPNARPFDMDAGASLIRQAKGAGIAVFFKQAGNRPNGLRGLYGPKGGDIEKMPQEFQIQQWPKGF